MGSKTDYFEDLALDAAVGNATFTIPSTVYSALFSVIPSDASQGTELVTTSGYTRVATTFTSAGATTTGQCENSGAVTFATAVSAYTVVGWGLMDTSTVSAGNMVYWSTVTDTAIGIGDQATFGVGAIVVSED